MYEDELIDGVSFLRPPPVRVSVLSQGKEVEFALGPYDMPIASTPIAEIIRRVAPAAAQFFPVTIEGAKRAYEIVNVVCKLECLDETRSEFTMWTEEDDRPEMMGQYKMISTIRIDPARAAGYHLFRIARWPLALLVSDTLKSAIEDMPNLGVVFKSVV